LAHSVLGFVHDDMFAYDGPYGASTRKVKPIWISMKQAMMGWQWHQVDHMQICILLQTYNRDSTALLIKLKLHNINTCTNAIFVQTVFFYSKMVQRWCRYDR